MKWWNQLKVGLDILLFPDADDGDRKIDRGSLEARRGSAESSLSGMQAAWGPF